MNAAVRAVTRMGIYVGAKVFLICEVRGASWLRLRGGARGGAAHRVPPWWSLVMVQSLRPQPREKLGRTDGAGPALPSGVGGQPGLQPGSLPAGGHVP